MCPLDRYLVDDLATQILPFFPDSDAPAISELLSSSVNSPKDKVGSDIGGSFTAANSISGFEAQLFSQPLIIDGILQNGSDESNLAQGLFTIFFGGGNPLRSVPAPHQIIFKNCHDADTCKIIEIQMDGCRINQAMVSVRVSGIDAPEVGTYYVGYGNKEKPNPFSPKLVENVDKLRGEWLGNTQLTKQELKLVNKFIAMHVDYTGRIAALIRNDLNTWNGSEGVPRTFEESQIRWFWEGEEDRTPLVLCNTWQPFDMFGRRLGSFYQMFPSFLSIYMRQRLPELMATEGREKYEEYRREVKWLIGKLNEIQKPKVQLLVQMLGDDFPNPEVIFSADKCNVMSNEHQAFINAHGEHYATDDQILQIITGSVYAYEKYRNQDGDAYQAANDIARQMGFGFWTEKTFKTIYEMNEQDPRHHPPHCPIQ